MENELRRLATFAMFPLSALCDDFYFSLLAEYGYFYTGCHDEIQCCNCHFKMRLNKNVGNLIAQHKLYSPFCFMTIKSFVPLTSVNIASVENQHQQNQFHGESIVLTSHNQPNYDYNTDEGTSHDNDVLTSHGIVSTDARLQNTNHCRSNNDIELDCAVKNPVLPSNDKNLQNSSDNVDTSDYKFEKNRLLTFQTWPKSDIVSPELLARDGFIYTLLGDRVKCVFCGGMLRAWEKNDNPAEEHERHYSTCQFICGHDVGNIPLTVEPRRKKISQKPTLYLSTNSGAINKIEAREIKARLDTPVVRNIHAMGYPMDLIRLVLLEQLTICGQDFPNMLSFVEALKTKQNEIATSEAQYDVAAAASMTSFTPTFQSIITGDSETLAKEHKQKPGKIDNVLLNNTNKQKPVETIGSSSEVLKSTNSDASNEAVEKEKTRKKRNKKKKTKKNITLSENRPSTVERSHKVNNEKKDIKDIQKPKTNQSQELNHMQSVNEVLTVNEAPPDVESLQPLTLTQPISMIRTGKCGLCHEEEINMAFIPCGHTHFCSSCGEPLNNCPLCQAKINRKIKVYLTSS